MKYNQKHISVFLAIAFILSVGVNCYFYITKTRDVLSLSVELGIYAKMAGERTALHAIEKKEYYRLVIPGETTREDSKILSDFHNLPSKVFVVSTVGDRIFFEAFNRIMSKKMDPRNKN
jgi:hypothetical protein